jgi:FMN phosphatase YigB (HAD superfamily)
MTPRAAILTDLDNTIYNWVDFYAPCFRAMVHVLARKTKIAESDITHQFRNVFSRFGSVEYPFSIQRLDLCHGRSDSEIRELVYLGQLAFGQARRKHLKPYAGVHDTLAWARRNNITVVAVSNAPLYLAWQRLFRLKLQGVFDGIAAAEGFSIPTDDIYASEYQSKRPLITGKLALYLPPDRLKPNPQMYTDVLAALDVRADETWIVGDSLAKDVAPALAIGANGIWARYGTEFEKRNFDTILEITHWSKGQITEVYNEQQVTPMAVIGTFSDLQDIVRTAQMRLL